MAVGLGQDQSSVNAWAYQVALELEQSFSRARELQTFLNATPDTTLEAAPYSFSANDVAVLKSAINDAVTLGNVYQGSAAQATPYDFRTFLKLLRGVSCW
jgi:hypothetical protein